LQKAKLDFISAGDKEKQIPYYWAAPIFIGIDESFGSASTTSLKSWIMIAALATVAAGIIILWRIKLRNQSKA